ncbi:GATOR1 complex protein NPRL2-like isoform X2 [Liolophura sinensis]|uniref:GATOR1 complex protein NPRL2-like isoform X2 n=1 Tax=Liolophura sinensis TaxID=3198878 RepID=UPI00315994D2
MLKAPDFIKCIFFSEFHPKKGPKITYQVPSNYISKEVFDAVHVYIITKPDLQNRLITINALGHKIVGCPVCIDDHKYKRNALIFNLCLVFDVLTQTCKYEIVVKKLATYLTQLELEREFLSNADSKQRLPEILQEILTKLNMCGHCSIPMSESNTIHLKVSPCVTDLPMIEEQDVPILLPDHSGPNLHHWDLTTQQIIGYIDGFNHVLRIASEADVEINLVKACVQNLLHYKVVKIISIFQQHQMSQSYLRAKNYKKSVSSLLLVMVATCLISVMYLSCTATSLQGQQLEICVLGTTPMALGLMKRNLHSMD